MERKLEKYWKVILHNRSALSELLRYYLRNEEKKIDSNCARNKGKGN